MVAPPERVPTVALIFVRLVDLVDRESRSEPRVVDRSVSEERVVDWPLSEERDVD
jgi:hypothetical protein